MPKETFRVKVICLETTDRKEAVKLRDAIQKKGKHAWIDTVLLNG